MYRTQLAQHHMSLCNDSAATSYTYVRQVRPMEHDTVVEAYATVGN